MSKLSLVIDKTGSHVTQSNGVLTIKTPNHTESLPIHFLQEIVIYGKAMVAADVWRALAKENIPATILPARGIGNPAWMGAGLAVNTNLRQQQYLAHLDNKVRLMIAQNIIQKKLEAQNLTLQQLGLESLDQQNIHAHSLEQLMGYEGRSARQYFQKMATYLPTEWQFNGRNRQPPKDPINALLSLSYTLMVSEIKTQIEIQGFDPWLGFVHQTYPARPALALDLIEPVRPEVDLWVIGLVEHLSPQHFTQTEAEGCRLTKEGRQIFYSLWAQNRQAWLGRSMSVQGVARHQVSSLKLDLQTHNLQIMNVQEHQNDELFQDAPF